MGDMADDVCQRCGEHEHYGCGCSSLELANFWAERASAQKKRIDELEQHIADMIDDSGQECACGYDNPTDICLGHKPMFDRMQKRIDELEACFQAISNAVVENITDNGSEEHRLLLDGQVYTGPVVHWAYSVLIEISNISRAALQPSTTEEKTCHQAGPIVVRATDVVPHDTPSTTEGT